MMDWPGSACHTLIVASWPEFARLGESYCLLREGEGEERKGGGGQRWERASSGERDAAL